MIVIFPDHTHLLFACVGSNCDKMSTVKPERNISAFHSKLPQPVPRNSVESCHGCTSRNYFDNAGDNVTLTLYIVTLTFDCNKTNGYK